MSKTGHIVTGIAVAAVAYHLAPKSPAIAAAALAGSLFPDVAEGVIGFWGESRLSLIPHRTLTHWLYLYVAMLFFAHRLGALPQALLIGLCAGSLLHIGLDAFSPMGIPLGNPFGERTSLVGGSTYRTGTLSEVPIILAVLFLASAAFLIHL